eukprot:15289314-Ditylum_brightwellii.AAC.1
MECIMAGRKRQCGNRRCSCQQYLGRKEVLEEIHHAIKGNEENHYIKVKFNSIIPHKFHCVPSGNIQNGIAKFQYLSVGKHVEHVVNNSSYTYPIDPKHIRHQYLVVLAPKSEFEDLKFYLIGSRRSCKYVLLLCDTYKGLDIANPDIDKE